MKPTFPAAALAQHIAILGKTGSGKTYGAKGIVEGLLKDEGRVCIIDPTGAWHGLRSSATGKSAGFPVVIFGGSHADLPLGAGHGEAIAEIIGTSSTPAIIDTSLMKVSERTQFFTDFGNAIVRKNKGPLQLVIDEAHLFAPQGRVNDPHSGAMLHAANNLVSLGRSRGLRIILITQRPAKLHKDSLTQVETLVAMRLIAPQDRRAVEDWIKDNADEKQGREIISSLATLKTGQGWIWAPEIGVLERVTFPQITTLDSSRAPDGESGPQAVLAPINREAIAEKLKGIGADALANDPATLKRQLAEARRQLAAKVPAAPKEDAGAAEARGYQHGRADAARDLKAVLVGARRDLLASIKDAAGKLSGDVSGTLDGLASAVTVAPAPHENRAVPARTTASAAQPRRAPPPAPHKSGNGTLPAPRQKILDNLAWLEDHGIYPAPKETLAAVAGVSPTSGGYFNNLGALKSAGMIGYPQPGMVDFTDEGRALAAIPDDDRPVYEHWLEVVAGPQRKILEALIERYPGEVSKDELANDINVSPTSGGYFNNLGRLRTLGAIDYPRPGMVALTKHVMP